MYSHNALIGEVLYVSSGFESVFGLSKNEILGKNWATTIHWLTESLELARRNVVAMAKREFKFMQFELSFVHPDCGERTILVSSHPAIDEGGEVRINVT